MDLFKKIGQFLLNPFGAKKEPEKPSYQSSGRSDNSRGGRNRPRNNSRGGQRSARPEGNSRGGRPNNRGGRNRFQSRDGSRPGGGGRSRRHSSGRPQHSSRHPNPNRGMHLKDSRNEELTGEKRRTEVPKEELIGTVTHFFDQVNAAAIRLDSGGLAVGDTVAFKGAETAFRMKIESLQIDRVPVPSAPRGSEVGVLVRGRVKEGDRVYRVL